MLNGDYVEHLLKRLAQEGAAPLPSPAVAIQAFETLGNRPEEMIKALRHLSRHLPPGANPDEHRPVIAATIRSTAADIELMKVAQLEGLAAAVFERMAAPHSRRGGQPSTLPSERRSSSTSRSARRA